MLIFRASAAAKAAARDLIRDLCGDVKNKLISMKTMQGLEKHLMCSPAACRDRSPIARDSDFHEFSVIYLCHGWQSSSSIAQETLSPSNEN